MPLWRNANSTITVNATTTFATTNGQPLFSYVLVNGGGGPNANFGNTLGSRANTTVALFNNTTTGAFVNNLKTGVFAINATSVTSNVPHAGWVLRIEGTGGRAGRVQYEVLVASSSVE